MLAERLGELLDDGTGSVRAELLPLVDALGQTRRPKGALTWTSKPHVQRNLRALARGEVPLTHEGLSRLTPWRSVAYLQRPNTMTATNPDARWLFPGRRAGQPMTPETLELRLRHLAFPTQRGRTAAIRHLVLQAPAPVVARMLGYHDDTTAQLAVEAGGTWRYYAPGDHSRSPGA
ncbi:hypothetical protein OG520_42240 (plasmid) [Streptomyces sp. NBC_00984]|uniref:hypothetical protein n=1 Tax=Streptomyces sp. NBC_00984 TaxID=2903700 RepID=UPI002F91569D|nr:hypothetical protein OG520_42240 [Streptomyces sp. NBC_00984]